MNIEELGDYLQVRPGPNGRHVIEFTYPNAEHTDEVHITRAKERNRFVREVAKRLNRTVGELGSLHTLMAAKAACADEQQRQAEEERADGYIRRVNHSARLLAETPLEVIEAAEAFLRNKNLFEELEDDLAALGIVGEMALAMAVYLIVSSRKLHQPLGGILQAASSSGKSYVTDRVLITMPAEDVIAATDITPQAMYYFPPGELKHSLIRVAERAHSDANSTSAANHTLALREMMSSGKLTKFVPGMGPGGVHITKKVEQDGPIAYLETTTQDVIFEEDATRMLKLTTDESAAQTARIIKFQQRAASGTSVDSASQQAIVAKHQAAQRMLQPKQVQIPFAPLITIANNVVAARRAFGQLLAVINVIAFLRQFQKTEVAPGVIHADLEDYKIAYRLMREPLTRVFNPLPDKARDLLEQIQLEYRGCNFTRKQCVELAGVGMTCVANRLKLLVEYGHVRLLNRGQGVKAIYTLIDADSRHVGTGLPTPEQLAEALSEAEPAPAQPVRSQPPTRKRSVPQLARKPLRLGSEDSRCALAGG